MTTDIFLRQGSPNFAAEFAKKTADNAASLR